MVVSNVGESFPKGCGYDVLDTGCCTRYWQTRSVFEDYFAQFAEEGILKDPNDPDFKDVGAISASRRVEAPSRHRCDSSPGMMEVGGFFFDFEAIRTASSDRDAPRRCL